MAARFPGPTLMILRGQTWLESMGFKGHSVLGEGRADVWEKPERMYMGDGTASGLGADERFYTGGPPISKILWAAAPEGLIYVKAGRAQRQAGFPVAAGQGTFRRKSFRSDGDERRRNRFA